MTSYQHTFGTKMVDFNPDTSPFKEIGNLIKEGKEKLINYTNPNYKLYLFVMI